MVLLASRHGEITMIKPTLKKPKNGKTLLTPFCSTWEPSAPPFYLKNFINAQLPNMFLFSV